MDISDIVSEDYVTFDPDTTVSKLVGTFDDPSIRGVVVHGDQYEGVVTRKQLASSHHPPEERVGSLVWHVPRLGPDEDIRKVAQLMIDSDAQLLPVFEGRDLVGVVTVDGILEHVAPYLDAATVREASTSDLITLVPESTLGEALNRFREYAITHLPVVEDGSAVGILSLYDVTHVTIRSATRSQGGEGGGTDSFGGEVSASAGRSRGGGFGAREGEIARVLDMPVRDVMVSPVATIHPEETLQTAVEEMQDTGGSSLVVTENGEPFGIVTKTDLLDALTWEADGHRGVQVYGIDHVDDLSHDDIVAMVDKFDTINGDASVLDARIHFHEHDEMRRGVPLLLVRVRLYTDEGLYMATGEGYGASHALNSARETLERRIRDDEGGTRRGKKHPNREFWEKRFGWILES